VGLNLNRYFYVLDRAGKTFIERMFFAKEASRRASSGGDLFVINPEEGGIPLDAKGAIELHDRLQLYCAANEYGFTRNSCADY